MSSEPHQRLSNLSSSARRLLDYVAVMEGGARYEQLRRAFRLPEPDMIADLKEVVDEGIIRAVSGDPNTYAFVDDSIRDVVLAEAGEDRLPKLRAKAARAQGRQ